MNSLQVAIDADASVASYLLGSIQAAFDLSGAVDEDHDQLKMLHDEISRLVVQLDYLRNQTTADIQRQSNYLTTERANIQALAFAISRGNSLANRPVVVNPPRVTTVPAPEPTAMNPPHAPQAAPMTPVSQGAPLDIEPAAQPTASSDTYVNGVPSVGRLLVLIRYNQPNVEYQQQLSQAVGAAIERRPNAEFSIVAVEAKRSLVQLGLAPSRITVASTLSQSAQSPEVHVYIR